MFYIGALLPVKSSCPTDLKKATLLILVNMTASWTFYPENTPYLYSNFKSWCLFYSYESD